MPLLLAEAQTTDKAAKAASDITIALRAARKGLRRGSMLRLIFSTVSLPLVSSAAWIALSRFTLLDLPQWPILFFFALWAIAVSIDSLSRRISDGQSARYLDRVLSLDERLGTLVEIAKATPVKSLSGTRKGIPSDLLEDTAFLLRTRLASLPNAWKFSARRGQVVRVGLALLALAAARAVPTSLDQVRAERAALQRTVAAELDKIAQMKTDLVTRPGLTDADRQAITEQLDSLSQSLSTPNLDRSALLAALSDAQQQLQQLSPQTSADFDNLVAAARNMQQATINATRGGALGSEVARNPRPTTPSSQTSARRLPPRMLLVRVSGRLPQISHGLWCRFWSKRRLRPHPKTASLARTCWTHRGLSAPRMWRRLLSALQQVSQRFQEADHRWQLTQSVEKIMSNLDESRQTLAQVDNERGQKKQVGFRRPASQTGNTAQSGTPGTRTGDTQDGNQGTQSDRELGPHSSQRVRCTHGFQLARLSEPEQRLFGKQQRWPDRQQQPAEHTGRFRLTKSAGRGR